MDNILYLYDYQPNNQKEMQVYPSDLTDRQWSKIENYFQIRKRKHSLRVIVNATLYIAKSGIQWRMLPKEYPKWELVYYYFRKWVAEGLIEEIHESLQEHCRKQAGRNESPSMGVMANEYVLANATEKQQKNIALIFLLLSTIMLLIIINLLKFLRPQAQEFLVHRQILTCF
ncbi:MAG: transposase [Bacteroidales bacterium]|jgi:transposase|nr:transposase [Bacteroidales bacterium]